MLQQGESQYLGLARRVVLPMDSPHIHQKRYASPFPNYLEPLHSLHEQAVEWSKQLSLAHFLSSLFICSLIHSLRIHFP